MCKGTIPWQQIWIQAITTVNYEMYCLNITVLNCNISCEVYKSFIEGILWVSFEWPKLFICMGLIRIPVFQSCWDFKSNQIGISLNPEVLPFLNLLSAALDPCVALHCYQGDPVAPLLPLQWSPRRDGGPRVSRCWACGRGERSILWAGHKHMGWKGGLIWSYWPSSRGLKPFVPALPSMPLNGAEQCCTVL